MWDRSNYLCGRFVFALGLIGHLLQQVVLGPGQVGDLHDQLRPHPVHARQLERRPEATITRWRLGQRHLRHLAAVPARRPGA
jgi:hypothetical protein